MLLKLEDFVNIKEILLYNDVKRTAQTNIFSARNII